MRTLKCGVVVRQGEAAAVPLSFLPLDLSFFLTKTHTQIVRTTVLRASSLRETLTQDSEAVRIEGQCFTDILLAP